MSTILLYEYDTLQPTPHWSILSSMNRCDGANHSSTIACFNCSTFSNFLLYWHPPTNNIKLSCFTTCVSKLLLHSAKIIKLRQSIQMLQAKTSLLVPLLLGHPVEWVPGWRRRECLRWMSRVSRRRLPSARPRRRHRRRRCCCCCCWPSSQMTSTIAPSLLPTRTSQTQAPAAETPDVCMHTSICIKQDLSENAPPYTDFAECRTQPIFCIFTIRDFAIDNNYPTKQQNKCYIVYFVKITSWSMNY